MNQKGQSEALGNRIAELRRKAGFTQEQLADKLGLTYQAVSKWENDLSCPDILLLPDLAHLLGISIDALLGQPSPAKAIKTDATLPDDQTLRLVLFRGHHLLQKKDGSIWWQVISNTMNLIPQVDQDTWLNNICKQLILEIMTVQGGIR